MTRAARPKAAPKAKESAIERAVIAVYVAAGFMVYKLSQGFRKEPGGTRQTPGLPDLLAFRGNVAVAHETKTPDGLRDHLRLRAMAKPPTGGQYKAWLRAQAQKRFADLWRAAGNQYAIGGHGEADMLIAELREMLTNSPCHPVTLGGLHDAVLSGAQAQTVEWAVFENESDDDHDAAFSAALVERIPLPKKRKGRAT